MATKTLKEKKPKAPKKPRPVKDQVASILNPDAPPSPVSLSDVVSVDSVALRSPHARGSIYDGVIEKMKTLKPGQGFVIEVPAGTPIKSMYNRLNTTINRPKKKPLAPSGSEFRKRTTKEGNIMVFLAKK